VSYLFVAALLLFPAQLFGLLRPHPLQRALVQSVVRILLIATGRVLLGQLGLLGSGSLNPRPSIHPAHRRSVCPWHRLLRRLHNRHRWLVLDPSAQENVHHAQHHRQNGDADRQIRRCRCLIIRHFLFFFISRQKIHHKII